MREGIWFILLLFYSSFNPYLVVLEYLHLII